MAFGLKPRIIYNIQNVFAQHPEVERVILYGSWARGNYTHGSDIDITLVGTNIDLSLLNKIENQLDDLMLPYTFDVSILDHIKNENLLKHIKRVGRDFYIKEQLKNK